MTFIYEAPFPEWLWYVHRFSTADFLIAAQFPRFLHLGVIPGATSATYCW